MNTTNNDSPSNQPIQIPDRVHELLGESGLEIDAQCRERLARHLALLSTWNNYASLVSIGDLEQLVEKHVVDALSLAPIVAAGGGPHLDIGSGGGFPAIPLKCLLPSLSLVLVERSAKKCGILRKIIGALGFEDVRLLQGEFPGVIEGLRPATVTARAVERPTLVLDAIRGWLPADSTFLVQSGDPRDALGDMFHVEHVEDAWHSERLRRGTLYLARRTTPKK